MSNLKKINAYLSLFTMALFVIHTVYEIYAYIEFIYDPILTKVLGYVLLGMIIIHAILSVIIVFVLHDSKSIQYKKLNVGTYFQRISAFSMILLAPLHIFSYGILESADTDLVYVLTEIGNVLFYYAIFIHIAISFSKSLVTIGVLCDDRIRKNIDRVMIIICPIICTATAILIVATHNMMFSI